MWNFPDAPVDGELAHGFKWQLQHSWQKSNDGGAYPKPALIQLAPAAAVINDPDVVVNIQGTLFWPASKIIWDGKEVPTVYVSQGHLQTTVKLNRAAGTVPVTVRTNGKTIAPALSFIYNSQPIATLTALSPTEIMQGATASIVLTGTNMRSDSKVLVDGVQVAMTYQNAGQLTATVTGPPKGDSKLSSQIVVQNGAAPSNALTLYYDVISVSGMSPLVATMNELVRLTVRGANFSNTDKIVVAGVQQTTFFVSANEIWCDYTPPYDALTVPVNVVGSRSPDMELALTDPRFTIRSTFPINYSDIAPMNWEVEIWGWGPIHETESIAHINGVPQQSWRTFNAVGTEYILMMHMDLTPYPDDTQVMISVCNKNIHWSNEWPFWIERFG